MAMINVNRDNPDPFYRYKMPSLIAKVEGKGNGIKTVIVNMVEIGKALGRPPSYPCKYFGCELGAQTQMDTKLGRYIVNGAHESPKLQDILDGFIKKFVLCPGCDNPETDLHIQASKARIGVSCKACGYQGVLDSRHKVTTFIINHPPNSTEDSSSKKGKKARKGEKQKGGKKSQASEGAPTSPTEEKGEEVFIPPPTQNGGDDDANWSVDTSEEAVKARKDDLTGLVSTLTLDDSEKSPAERVNIFFKFVEGLIKSSGPSGVQTSLAKVKTEAERLDVMDKAAGILAELLYTDQLLSQIKEYRTIMLPFVVDNKKSQKYLLIGFEKLVGEVHPQLLAKVPHILKAFYDEDILEEESILEWADKASTKHVNESIAKQIHEKAAPIVAWLRTAEEESSGEEEEEDEVEVVYSESAGNKGITTITEKPPQPAEEGGTDIDIDAI